MRTPARSNRRSKTCLGLQSRSTTAASPGRCGSATRPWISLMGCAAGCAAEDRAERADRRSAPPQAESRRCLDHLGWDLLVRGGGELQPLCRTPCVALLLETPPPRLASDKNKCRTCGGPKRPTPEEEGRMARYRFHCT